MSDLSFAYLSILHNFQKILVGVNPTIQIFQMVHPLLLSFAKFHLNPNSLSKIFGTPFLTNRNPESEHKPPPTPSPALNAT